MNNLDGLPESTEADRKRVPDRFWFRVMNEVLHDMAFIQMSDAHLGIYIRLLALANSTRTLGFVPGGVDQTARALRLKKKDLESALAYFSAHGLIFVEDGFIAIADSRHFEGKGLTPSQSRQNQRDRQAKHRAKLREEAQQVTGCHGDMSRDIEQDSDSIEQRQLQNQETYQAKREEGPLEDEETDLPAGSLQLEGFDDVELL